MLAENNRHDSREDVVGTERPAAARQERNESPILQVAGASHTYGDVAALKNVSLTVGPGEFLTLLGPSGSGKTTLLRIIAGLETPSAIGTLRIAGSDVRGAAANHRNVATVFQHFALFPHMSVGENVEYGLRVRGRPPEERQRRALQALEYVRLPSMYGRRVHQLSGGERQRVALARALVTEPAILLLDEPLGSLDEKLRLEMQVELSELQRRLRTTFIHVTHSQEEALTMSDRVVLLREGQIEQEGTPRELFERPATRFVADFMGFENILRGVLAELSGSRASVKVGESVIHGAHHGTLPITPGTPVFAAVRAEKMRFSERDAPPDAQSNRFPCRAVSTIYKGKYSDLGVETEAGRLTGRVWDPEEKMHSPTQISWQVADCIVAPDPLANDSRMKSKASPLPRDQ